MKKYFILLSFVLVSLSFFKASASSYSLYYYQNQNGNNILINQGIHEEKMPKYICNFIDMSCNSTTTTSIKNSYPINTINNINTNVTNSFYSDSNNSVILEEQNNQNNGIITQYVYSSFINNNWSSSSILNISNKVSQVIFSDINESKAVIVTNKDKSTFNIIFYDLITNSIISSTTTTDRITNAVYSSDGNSFAYYVPSKTNINNQKKYVLIHNSNNNLTRSEWSWTVAKNWELLTDANRLDTFSPSGKSFGFLEDKDDYPTPYYLSSNTNGLSQAINIGWADLGEVADYILVSDNTALLVSNTKSNPYNWSLYTVDIASGTHKDVLDNVSILYPITQLNTNRFLIPVMSGPNMEPVIYDSVQNSTSTFPSLSWTVSDNSNKKTVMNFSNDSHGVFLSGTSTKKSLPLIVWLHGGPFRQASFDFHSYPSYATYDWILDQTVATNKANVLKLDYPGSYGYGNNYAYSLVDNLGVIDTKSIIEDIREFRKEKGLTGPVLVMGNSYGGYLAAKLIVDYPKEINYSLPINGVYEWRTLLNYLNSSIFNVDFDGLYDPTNPTIYNSASITKNISKLTKNNKITIAVSTSDSDINPDQAYTLYEAIQSQKKNVNLVLFPGDDHILKKVSSNELLCTTLFDMLKIKNASSSCKL